MKRLSVRKVPQLSRQQKFSLLEMYLLVLLPDKIIHLHPRICDEQHKAKTELEKGSMWKVTDFITKTEIARKLLNLYFTSFEHVLYIFIL